MNTQTLLDNFSTLADAPGGIPRLRELILSLAVRGQLVETMKTSNQSRLNWDPTDLRLDEKKIWQVWSGLQVPTDWNVVPLAAVGKWGSGGTPTKGNRAYYNGTIPWLVIGDLNDSLVTKAENHITPKGLAESSATMVPIGAVLIAMYGSIGKSGIAGIECEIGRAHV